MLATAPATLPQAIAPTQQGSGAGVLAVVVTPRENRPVERSDAGSGATARNTNGNLDADQDGATGKVEFPLGAPDDPARANRGRNMNLVFDEKSGRTIIEIINARTGEILDRIPPEDLLERAERDGLSPRANLVDQTV